MRAHILAFTALSGCFLASCESSRALEVSLELPTVAELNPLSPEFGVQKIRVYVRGDLNLDEAYVDLAPNETKASFTLQSEEAALIEAKAFDSLGTLVGYAIRRNVALEESENQVQLSLRRSLAYITHRANAAQRSPGAQIYQLDMRNRGFVSKFTIPGDRPVAASITAKGGEAMLIAYSDIGKGMAGILSTADHSFQSIPLEGPQDVVLGAEGSDLGVAVGGGRVSYLNFAEGTAEADPKAVGGRVLDAAISGNGQYALVAIDIAPGLLYIDIKRRKIVAQNVLPDPSGIALDASGQLAYVTSKTDPRVVAFDLLNSRINNLRGVFARPVSHAVYSDDSKQILGVALEANIGQVLAYHIPTDEGRPYEEALSTLANPMGMAIDGPGSRAIVIAAGTGTVSAGITVMDALEKRLHDGSGTIYPGDPDDRYEIAGGGPDRPKVFASQRYQPNSVAVIYGR